MTRGFEGKEPKLLDRLRETVRASCGSSLINPDELVATRRCRTWKQRRDRHTTEASLGAGDDVCRQRVHAVRERASPAPLI